MFAKRLSRMFLIALTVAATSIAVVAGSSSAPAYAADPTLVEYGRNGR